jgi:transcriptional regulator with XRE-family HTH domain
MTLISEQPLIESIGKRIKALRRQRNLTLAGLAEQSNLSASHLSQVERDKTTPSLMTLSSIAQALDVSLRDLFDSEDNQLHLTRATGAEPLPGPVALAWSQLTSPATGRDLEVHRLTLPPGAPWLEFEPYSGEIVGFVLSGTLALRIDDDPVELAAGDSIHCDARQAHRIRCGGETPCTVVWCTSPPRPDMNARFEAVLEQAMAELQLIRT